MRAAPGAACVQRDVRPARAGNAGHVRGWPGGSRLCLWCRARGRIRHCQCAMAHPATSGIGGFGAYNGKPLAWAAVRTGVALPLRSGVCILTFIFFLSTSSRLALNHSHAHVSHANPRSSRLHVSAASCHHGERAGGHQGSGKQLAAVACPSRHHGERTRGHEGTLEELTLTVEELPLT